MGRGLRLPDHSHACGNEARIFDVFQNARDCPTKKLKKKVNSFKKRLKKVLMSQPNVPDRCDAGLSKISNPKVNKNFTNTAPSLGVSDFHWHETDQVYWNELCGDKVSISMLYFKLR